MNCLRVFGWSGLASLLVCSAGSPALAQGIPGRGRAIQFSDPKVEVVTSNLNHSASSKKSSLRTLDDQFKAPFNFLDAAGAGKDAPTIQPVLRPPTLSPRAVRQLLDKQKEESQWIFGSPEELEARRLSAERMFGVAEFDENGMAKTEDESPLQRYWDRADREQNAVTNRVSSDAAHDKTDQEIKDQARVMFGVAHMPAAPGTDFQPGTVKSSLTPTYSSAFAPDLSPVKTATELFAAPAAEFTPQKIEAASRMNEFKQLFDMKSPNLGGTAVATAPAFSRPASSADFGGASGATFRPSSAAPAPSLNALPGSSFSKPLGSVGAATFTPPPPPLTPTPRASVPPAGFQLPKRTF